MYKVFQVRKKEGQPSQTTLMGEVVEEETAIRRTRRLGGFATHLPTKKLVVQTLVPLGPKYQPALVSISSGEDVE